MITANQLVAAGENRPGAIQDKKEIKRFKNFLMQTGLIKYKITPKVVTEYLVRRLSTTKKTKKFTTMQIIQIDLIILEN